MGFVVTYVNQNTQISQAGLFALHVISWIISLGSSCIFIYYGRVLKGETSVRALEQRKFEDAAEVVITRKLNERAGTKSTLAKREQEDEIDTTTRAPPRKPTQNQGSRGGRAGPNIPRKTQPHELEYDNNNSDIAVLDEDLL